jgi:ketosteroid isomerase-like protein
LTVARRPKKVAGIKGANTMTNRLHAPLLIALAAASLLAGCNRAADSTAVADQVRKDAHALVAAFNRQDAASAAAFDAPDYVGIYHGSANTIGPAADEAGMKAQMAAAKVEWQVSPGKVTMSKAGDIGIFETPYTFVINIPGAPVTREHGTWTAIFRQQADGSMKLWRSIASDIPAAKAGA